jgi:PAS domain S-box-containing protein
LILRLYGGLVDITECKRMEEVRAASLHVRNPTEASLDPLITIRPDGRITDVNKATELVTGFSRDQLIGSNFSDYFTDPEKARRGYEEVIAKGFVKDYDLAIRDKSGKVTDVLYNATVYRDERGKVQGVFAAARDITERKRMEARLAESQRLAAIGSTATMVGHDLRNPLQALAAMVYLLKKHYEGIPIEYKKTTGFDATETLHMMEKSVGYMNKIVSDLQNYAAPLRPELLNVSTHQLLKETLSTIAIPAQVKVSVTVNKGAETLNADPDLIKRTQNHGAEEWRGRINRLPRHRRRHLGRSYAEAVRTTLYDESSRARARSSSLQTGDGSSRRHHNG